MSLKFNIFTQIFVDVSTHDLNSRGRGYEGVIEKHLYLHEVVPNAWIIFISGMIEQKGMA